MSEERSSPPLLGGSGTAVSREQKGHPMISAPDTALLGDKQLCAPAGIREDAEQLPLNVHMELVGLKDSILGGQAKEFSEGLKGIFVHLGNLVSFWRTTAGFMVNLPLQIPTSNGSGGSMWHQGCGNNPMGSRAALLPVQYGLGCKGGHYRNTFRAPQAISFSCPEEVKEWYCALFSRL